MSIDVDMKEKLTIFRALGEETKFRILKALIHGEKCACELPEIIKKTQSNTSMHLAKLQDWRLISSKREGKKIIYSIKDKRVYGALRIVGIKK
ncbi:winged helix-turn-helix transcriptional regulator [Candidatus Woesearchaeota archaeon]|nr:winged helix-turn-helix transcriptional regulator [Candidatus Woesearchaeota archaeon]